MVDNFRRGEAGTDGNSPIEGRAPGIAYGDGPQKQLPGMVGKIGQAIADRWRGLFPRGVKRKDCGPIDNPVCAEVSANFLEQTFRNFHINSAPRTNLAPPWTAITVDPVNSGTFTTVNAQTLATIVSYTVPTNRIAIIHRLGQLANTPAAFGDTTWRLVTSAGVPATGAGRPVFPYQSLSGAQWFDWFGTILGNPIKVFGGTTISWQVSVTTAGASYGVAGRLIGWEFAPLFNTGDNIGSAIAD